MRLMLVGASGIVGQQVLRLALDHPEVTTVVAPVRKPLPAAPRLECALVDFAKLPDAAPWWRADAVICTLGTTMALAGSEAAFRRVDHDYPLAVAQRARAAGAQAFVLLTALGASAGSRVFYSRVKGEVEDAVRALDYPSLTLVRPSLIEGGPRPDRRRGEGVALRLARVLRPLLPARYRAVSSQALARTLLAAALARAPGVHVIESEAIG